MIHGKRNMSDELWDIQLPSHNQQVSLPSPSSTTLNNIKYIITKDKSKGDLVRYIHGTAFDPRISTLTIAVEKVLRT